MAPNKETTSAPLPPRPRISVIIPAYNLGRFVGDTVASVLATRYESLEIIVVDDESTDNTPEVLQPYREQGLIQYYRITNNGLAGPGGAINEGLKRATGELVQCLDADDCVEPTYFDAVCEVFSSNPDIDGVCTHATVIDQHNHPLSTLESGRFASPEEFRLQSLAGNLVISSSMIVKRACYDVVGGRRPRFQICCDYDMWLRIGERFNLHVIPRPLVRYRRHQNNISSALERMRSFDQDLLNHYIQRNPIEFFIPTALKTNPDAADRHLRALASLMEKRGFPQLAEPFLAALLRRSPKDADTCQRLSNIHYHCGDPAKAEHYATRALQGDPANAAAQTMLHDLTPLPYQGRQPHHTLSVLLVADRFSASLPNPTDGELHTTDLAQSLARAGAHVAVLHSLYDSQSVEEFGVRWTRDEHVNRIQIHLPRNRPFMSELQDGPWSAQLIPKLLEQHFDVIHFQGLRAGVAPVVARHLVPHQSALFLSVHDAALICEQKALITAEHQLCEGPTTPAKCADCIAERRRLSTNHQTLTALAQGVDLQGRFIQSIVRRMDHVFVSTQEHLTTLADFDISGEALSKRRHGIPHTPSLPATPSPTLRFTCMNNLGMVHGLDHLLSSFARIAGPRVELNIYGEEQTDLDLHALGVDLNQLSISYRGPCRNEHLPHILSQTDVGVVPFRHEHCSRAARQFLHAGIPVIAADSGGTPELVTHGVNGRLFQPNDRDSMVAALTFFLEHPHALPAYRANTQRQRLIDDDARELLRLYQQARPQTNAGLSHRT